MDHGQATPTQENTAAHRHWPTLAHAMYIYSHSHQPVSPPDQDGPRQTTKRPDDRRAPEPRPESKAPEPRGPETPQLYIKLHRPVAYK